MINTFCKDCVFADFENKKQIGCHLGKLDIFKQRKEIKLIEENDESHYNIERLCPFFRNKSSSWNDNSLEELKIKVKNEISLKITIVIICHDNFPLSDLEKTLQSIKNQNNKMVKIIRLGLPTNRPKPISVFNILKESGLQHKVHLITERNNGKPLNYRQISDIVVGQMLKKEASHIFFIEVGAEIENGYLDRINQNIVEDLDKWLMIKSCLDEQNKRIGPIVQQFLYNKCGGNKDAIHDKVIEDNKIIEINCNDVEDKITLMCIDDGNEGLIKKYEDYTSN